MSKVLKKLELWASSYINIMALIRTLLAVFTGMLSLFIFLEIFGYMGV